MDSNQAAFINPSRSEKKPSNSTKLATLPVSIEAMEGILHLPEGYSILSAVYDEQYRMLKFLVTSKELPEVKELQPLPNVDLHVSVEFLPEDHRFRRIKTT